MKKFHESVKKFLSGGKLAQVYLSNLKKFGSQLLPIAKIMKKITLALTIGASVIGSVFAQTSTLDRNASWNLTGSNQNFTFSQFDSTLGTLTAIQLILNSATVSGSVNITNNTGLPISIDALRSRINLSGTGFTSNTTTNTVLPSSPSTSGGFLLGGSSSQAFTLTSTSLLGLPSTTAINAGSWAAYTGSGNTPNFTARLVNTVSSDAGDPLNDLTNSFSFSAPGTSVTLRYTYTPSIAPIPEPGQVAASLLLLSGIGAYVFIKRRKKSAPAAA
jgi:hypothetical protein